MESDEAAETMVCRRGDREQLRLASSGSGTWSGPDDAQVSFHLEVVAALAGGFCGFTDNGVLVLWESAGAVDGASGVAFIDSARRGVAWQRMYGMVNIGHPLIKDGVLYFTAMAFVGAVRVNDGMPIWSRGGLWRPGLYGGFSAPEMRGNTVRFSDRYSDATLVVEMATGRILEGAPPKWAPGDGPDSR